MPCPFYGYSGQPRFRALFGTNGNQCALVTCAISPCRMEVHDQREPNLEECELRGTAQANLFVTFDKYEYKPDAVDQD